MNTKDSELDTRETDENRDPISGALGAHPVGVGVGAAIGGVAAGVGSGAALGAMTGTVVGPVGTAVGAAVGAIVGGLAGKSVAEAIDPTVEQTYWRQNYAQRPYVERGRSFEDYGPAYHAGISAFAQYPGTRFDEVEPKLSREWSTTRGTSTLDWDNARAASQDAWNRLKESATKSAQRDSADSNRVEKCDQST